MFRILVDLEGCLNNCDACGCHFFRRYVRSPQITFEGLFLNLKILESSSEKGLNVVWRS